MGQERAMNDGSLGPGGLERPVLANEPGDYWGSDAVALMLRELDLPYVALNPGASYRGLHDSLVNLLGNSDPQMLLCLHEEHAVAIAHGYAKVTGRPMGAIVHSNVGLMHATMAIFDAWCDRVPVFVLGATGPVDAAKRRPWIDWIHTAQDQGALVRNFTKWDDQPASVAAAAEALGAVVLTDAKTGAGFPSTHKLHGPPAGNNPSADAAQLIRAADVVLSLDWVDLAGALKAGCGEEPVGGKIILASLDHLGHNGWSMDYQALPPTDLHLAVEPDIAVAALLPLLKPRQPGWRDRPAPTPPQAMTTSGDSIAPLMLAAALREAVGTRPTCLIRGPLAWAGNTWDVAHPLDALGGDGGGGVGAGPGMAVGAALALRGSGRLPIAVLGDGDFLMGATALWTAVHYRIPLLVVVSNNNSFFNDELHQDRMARQRGRPVANRWIGQRIADPEPDLGMLARAQGGEGFGPIRRPDELSRALRAAIDCVLGGGVAVVDVRVEPGYAPVNSASIA